MSLKPDKQEWWPDQSGRLAWSYRLGNSRSFCNEVLDFRCPSRGSITLHGSGRGHPVNWNIPPSEHHHYLVHVSLLIFDKPEFRWRVVAVEFSLGNSYQAKRIGLSSGIEVKLS